MTNIRVLRSTGFRWAARLITVIVLGLASLGAVSAVSADPLKFPDLTGPVVDDAHLLSPAQVQDITAKSQALEEKTGRQLVIATVPSLQGQPIDDFGYQLGRAWGIGQKGQNNGVVFLIAPTEHKVRIEVGYGLEPILTDALTSVILHQKVLPQFKAGDFGQGIVDGTDALVEQLGLDDQTAHARVADAELVQRQIHVRGRSNPLGGLLALIVIFFVIQSIFRGRGGAFLPMMIVSSLMGRRDDDFGGGGGGFSDGGGGGGFSGGGGSFGGGGASGDW